jgi:hypothetical protein
MRARTARWRVGLTLLLAGSLVACGGKDKGSSTPTDVANLSPEERQLLFDLNARFNRGRTFRWATLPIAVFLNGLGRPDEVTRWTGASGGRVSFTFVSSVPEHGVGYRLVQQDPGVCGEANIFGPGDEIEFVDILLNPVNIDDPGCANVVTHEAGHSIGILAHTSDGGLMDFNGGNGRITDAVARMVANLYSFPPGTPVVLSMQARARQGRGLIVRIVDYKR